MKEKVVRCVQDRTGIVDDGYDYTIQARNMHGLGTLKAMLITMFRCLL